VSLMTARLLQTIALTGMVLQLRQLAKRARIAGPPAALGLRSAVSGTIL
jgi:hypothetical protein